MIHKITNFHWVQLLFQGPRDFQAELASKLGLAKAPPASKKKARVDNDVQDKEDDWETESVQHDTDSLASHKSKKKPDDTKSISSRRSTKNNSLKVKRSESTISENPSIASTKKKKSSKKKKKDDSLKSTKSSKKKGSDDEGKEIHTVEL